MLSVVGPMVATGISHVLLWPGAPGIVWLAAASSSVFLPYTQNLSGCFFLHSSFIKILLTIALLIFLGAIEWNMSRQDSFPF